MVEKTDDELAADFVGKFLEATVKSAANDGTWVDDDLPNHKKVSAEESKTLFEKRLYETLDPTQEAKRYERGFDLILQHLGEYPNDRLCLKELQTAAQILAASIKEMVGPEQLEKAKVLLSREIAYEKIVDVIQSANPPDREDSQLELPPSIAHQCHLSVDTLSTIYEIGSKLFNENQIEEAICVFAYLTFLDGYNHDVWLSLGICYSKAQEWISAIKSYTMASLMKPENPMPYLYSIDCFLALNDKLDAEASLYMANYFINDENREKMAKSIAHYESLLNQYG